MFFKLSNLNSNLALTLGYLNPALNNSAQAGPLATISAGLAVQSSLWKMIIKVLPGRLARLAQVLIFVCVFFKQEDCPLAENSTRLLVQSLLLMSGYNLKCLIRDKEKRFFIVFSSTPFPSKKKKQIGLLNVRKQHNTTNKQLPTRKKGYFRQVRRTKSITKDYTRFSTE